MISLVTVTYLGEYSLTYLQAKSIIKFADPSIFSEVIIIDNSIENYHSLDFPLMKTLCLLDQYGFKARVVKKNELIKFYHNTNESSWRDQQLLKLMIADSISTDTYLLLDAKNFFIKKLNIENFIKHGKLITFKFQCPVALQKWLKASCQFIQVQLPEDWICLPTATPYLMRKSVVQNILKSPNFISDFYRNPYLTEFFIYFAYLAKNNMIDEIYAYEKQFYATFFTTYPDTPESIAIVKKLLNSDWVYCASFHRNRIINKDKVVIEIMTNLVTEKEIATNGEIELIISKVQEYSSVR